MWVSWGWVQLYKENQERGQLLRWKMEKKNKNEKTPPEIKDKNK